MSFDSTEGNWNCVVTWDVGTANVIQEGAGYGYKYSTGRNGQEDESSSKCAIPVSFKISFFFIITKRTSIDYSSKTLKG